MFGTLVDFIETLKFAEVQALHQLDELDRGGHERLDRVLALELTQILGSEPEFTPIRIGVPNSARALGPTFPTLSGPPMLPGVQADAVRACLERLERERVVEVDISDHRNRRVDDDRPQRFDVLLPGGPRRARYRRPASATRLIWSIVAWRSAVSVFVIV